MEAQAERTHIGIYSLFSLSLSSLLDHQKSLGQGPSMGNATRLMGYGQEASFLFMHGELGQFHVP